MHYQFPVNVVSCVCVCVCLCVWETERYPKILTSVMCTYCVC